MKLDPNIADPDGLYEALVNAHAGLSDQESVALNARLVFLLANQIGEPSILYDCINHALHSLHRNNERGE